MVRIISGVVPAFGAGAREHAIHNNIVVVNHAGYAMQQNGYAERGWRMDGEESRARELLHVSCACPPITPRHPRRDIRKLLMTRRQSDDRGTNCTFAPSHLHRGDLVVCKAEDDRGDHVPGMKAYTMVILLEYSLHVRPQFVSSSFSPTNARKIFI